MSVSQHLSLICHVPLCVFKMYHIANTCIENACINSISSLNVSMKTVSITNHSCATATFQNVSSVYALNFSIVTASITNLLCATPCFQIVSLSNNMYSKSTIKSISTNVGMITESITNLLCASVCFQSVSIANTFKLVIMNASIISASLTDVNTVTASVTNL